MTATDQSQDINVAAYLKALCHVNEWRSIRVENGEGVIGVYRAGEGFRVAGGVSVTDAEIGDVSVLVAQAVEGGPA